MFILTAQLIIVAVYNFRLNSQYFIPNSTLPLKLKLLSGAGFHAHGRILTTSAVVSEHIYFDVLIVITSQVKVSFSLSHTYSP